MPTSARRSTRSEPGGRKTYLLLDGYQQLIAFLRGKPEGRHQRRTIATIPIMTHHRDVATRCQQAGGVVGQIARAERATRVFAAADSAVIEDQGAALLGEVRDLERKPPAARASHSHDEHQGSARMLPG